MCPYSYLVKNNKEVRTVPVQLHYNNKEIQTMNTAG